MGSIKTRANQVIGGMIVCAVALFLLLVPEPALANQVGKSETANQLITDPKCVSEMKTAAAKRGQNSAQYVAYCQMRVHTWNSAPKLVSVNQAKAFASDQGMTPIESEKFVKRAAAGQIRYSDWEASTSSLFWMAKEIIKGRTFFDGQKSWIAKYRGYAGYQQCSAKGSYAVGMSISNQSCTKYRTIQNGVSSVYSFRATFIAKGWPVSSSKEIAITIKRNGSLALGRG